MNSKKREKNGIMPKQDINDSQPKKRYQEEEKPSRGTGKQTLPKSKNESEPSRNRYNNIDKDTDTRDFE